MINLNRTKKAKTSFILIHKSKQFWNKYKIIDGLKPYDYYLKTDEYLIAMINLSHSILCRYQWGVFNRTLLRQWFIYAKIKQFKFNLFININIIFNHSYFI